MNERARGGLLNVGIGVLALVLLALGYGLFSRVLAPTAPVQVVAEEAVDIPQVEVLNGTGVDGLAAQARRYLADHGVDVLATGNAPASKTPRTLVLSRTGDLAAARRVAAVLGLGEGTVRSQPEPDLLLDATVLLGEDYRSLAPFQADSSR